VRDDDHVRLLYRAMRPRELRLLRAAFTVDLQHLRVHDVHGKDFIRHRLEAIDHVLSEHDAIEATARQAVGAGATHDCGEWLSDGVCALCGRRT
jgi:predicted DCC family thiol-disulfide oxidoreductase YuxK